MLYLRYLQSYGTIHVRVVHTLYYEKVQYMKKHVTYIYMYPVHVHYVQRHNINNIVIYYEKVQLFKYNVHVNNF